MIGLEVSGWNQAKETILLNENATIGEVELLFTKVEDETVAAQVNKLEETKKQNELNAWAPNPIKPNTNIDEFGKMDIRVGTVLECV